MTNHGTRDGVPTERNRYFQGKFMTARDFARDQEYFLARQRRHNLLLHGHGIVEGLDVSVVTETSDDGPVTMAVVAPGSAIDPLGREIHLDRERRLTVDGDGSGQVVALEYREQPQSPVPSLDRSTGDKDGSEFNVVVESAHVFVGDGRRGEALLLARIEGGRVDPSCRRDAGLGATVIESISWPHGGELARDALEKSGWTLELRFSDDLSPAAGAATGIHRRTCRAEAEHAQQRSIVRVDSGCQLDDDRRTVLLHLDPAQLAEEREGGALDGWVRVTLSCDFILDALGRPVCGRFPGGTLPTSHATAGGIFESWFRIDGNTERS